MSNKEIFERVLEIPDEAWGKIAASSNNNFDQKMSVERMGNVAVSIYDSYPVSGKILWVTKDAYIDAYIAGEKLAPINVVALIDGMKAALEAIDKAKEIEQ